MSIVTYLTDTITVIFRTGDQLPLVGFDSPFTDKPHPGTNNKVSGWKWDNRVWPSTLELQSQEASPSIFDPDNVALNQIDFQSGIGASKDIEVIDIKKVFNNKLNVWAPEVNHGYYYDGELEGILFSDDSTTEYLTQSGFMGSLNWVDLAFTPKPGFPIEVKKFQWNSDTATYDTYLRLKKKSSFTGIKTSGVRVSTRDTSGNIILANIDNSLPEFVVDPSTATSPVFKVITNKDYFTHHGTDPAVSLSGMEVLGTSTGAGLEEFHFAYSPLISGGSYATTTKIVSFITTAGPYDTWTVVLSFTGAGKECIVDYDLGVVRFNESPAAHPAVNETIAAWYWSAPGIEYEPINSRDTITGQEVDIDPLGKTANAGFLYLKKELIEPYSITLDSEAPIIALPDLYGPAYLGTATKIRAKVSSKSGELIEGALVTFNLTNTVGAFSGGLTSISSLSSFQGVAKTLFNAPRNIKTLGAVSSDVIINASKTEITLGTTALVGDPTSWYVYKVFDDDPTLGISNIDQSYIDYFTQEGITGPTTTMSLDSKGSGWEQTHRILTGLLTPVQYNAAIRNGRKQLVINWDATAINPHNNPYNPALTGAFVPLRPESSSPLGAQTKVVINAVLPIPRSSGNESLAGYFIVGPTVATMQATVYNERLRTTIVSNTLQLRVQVPSSMDGTVLVENLNAAQKAELFSTGTLPTSGILPLGFRLKTSTLNMAAVLDGLTYFDINVPTEVLGHAFTIKSP